MKKPGATEWMWAPWRMPYVKKVAREKKPGGCFLCDYARRPAGDPTNLVFLMCVSSWCGGRSGPRFCLRAAQFVG